MISCFGQLSYRCLHVGKIMKIAGFWLWGFDFGIVMRSSGWLRERLPCNTLVPIYHVSFLDHFLHFLHFWTISSNILVNGEGKYCEETSMFGSLNLLRGNLCPLMGRMVVDLIVKTGEGAPHLKYICWKERHYWRYARALYSTASLSPNNCLFIRT